MKLAALIIKLDNVNFATKVVQLNVEGFQQFYKSICNTSATSVNVSQII